MPIVAICKRDNKESIRDLTKRALDYIDLGKILPGNSVLVKPNYVTAEHPSTGITTHPEVIAGILETLLERDIKDVIIGEGGIPGTTEKSFEEICCTKKVAKEFGVSLVNLNKDKRLIVPIPEAKSLIEVGVAKTALDVNHIISVPTLKTHSLSEVTLGMKNIMGAILPKNIMHKQIHDKIVDLASLLTPSLTVVDGTQGSEGSEIGGSHMTMDLIVSGLDVVSVDSVSTACMGIDPKQVKYLMNAQERGLGISNLEKIRIVGKTIDEVAKKFRR